MTPEDIEIAWLRKQLAGLIQERDTAREQLTRTLAERDASETAAEVKRLRQVVERRGEEKPAAYARFSPNGETLGLTFEPDDVTPAVRAQLEPLYRRAAPSQSVPTQCPTCDRTMPDGVAKLREEADQCLADMHNARKAEIAKLRKELRIKALDDTRREFVSEWWEVRDPEGRRIYDVDTRAEAEEWREEGESFVHVRRYRLSPAAKPRIQKST